MGLGRGLGAADGFWKSSLFQHISSIWHVCGRSSVIKGDLLLFPGVINHRWGEGTL